MIPDALPLVGIVVAVIAGIIVTILFTTGKLSTDMLGKWENKEITSEEWGKLYTSKDKNTKFVMNLSDGRVLIKSRTPKPPKDSKERMTDSALPKEVKLKGQIQVRFMRLKKLVDSYGRPKMEDGKQITKGVVLSKSKIPRKAKLITRKTGLKQLPYAMHFVDHSMLDRYDTLSYDEDWAEPINPDTGEPEWSDELEELITQGGHGQMIEVATRFWRFVLTRQHLIFMCLGVLAGFFVVVGLASLLHLFGGIQVNWSNHPVS